VDAPEATQIGPERGARALTGVAMDLASTITIVIPRPFAHPVGYRGMARMTTTITLPLIRIEQRATGGDVVRNQVAASAPVGMIADPPTLLSRIARDDTDDGRAIVRIRPMPFALVGTSSRWICRVRVRRAFFPRRCGTARRLRRLSPASSRSGRSRGGDLEYAAAGYGVVCVTALTRVPGGPSARLWRCHAARGPASLDVGESWQRLCW
jgi:hypothetical protein